MIKLTALVLGLGYLASLAADIVTHAQCLLH